MLERCRKTGFQNVCKLLPKPARALHVMRLFESSLKFIVVSNSNKWKRFAALQRCKGSVNNAYAWCIILWAKNWCDKRENQRIGPHYTPCQNRISDLRKYPWLKPFLNSCAWFWDWISSKTKLFDWPVFPRTKWCHYEIIVLWPGSILEKLASQIIWFWSKFNRRNIWITF